MRLGLSLLAAALFALPSFAAETWNTTAEGQTLLRPFRAAPYPHPSRQDGFKGREQTYPYAGHYDDSTVAVFVPAGYAPGKTVDFVVHFHGHLSTVAGVLDAFDLRRQFVASGLNAILVATQGPRNAADSGGGRLELEPGAFRALLQEVADVLVAEGKTTSARLGKVAITTHSGGYKVTAAVLTHGGLDANVTDVLLFDSSYGSLEQFADWARRGKGRRLVSIFTEHLASANVQLMAFLQRRGVKFSVDIERAGLPKSIVRPRGVHFLHTLDLDHGQVVAKRDYFADWLADSALAKRAVNSQE